MKKLKWLLFCIVLFNTQVSLANITRIDYAQFSIWMNCERRAPVMFFMALDKDNGDKPQLSQFYLDENIELTCQQSATTPYTAERLKVKYDRGHLVTPNAMDDNELSMREAFYMTNVVPQVAEFNTGAWALTEDIQECLRDEAPTAVLGGLKYDNTYNDHFVDSHGIPTPDYFWKIIVSGDTSYVWYFPNSREATKKNIDKYLISISDLEKKINYKIPIEIRDRDSKARKSYRVTRRCDLPPLTG